MPRSLSPALFALAVLSSASGIAAGAESSVLVEDIRLGFGLGAMPDEYAGSGTTPASASIVHRYDDSPGLSVMLSSTYGQLEPVGVLYGVQFTSLTGEMDYESLTVNGSTSSAKNLKTATGDNVPGMGFSQTGMAVNLGAGWALTPGCHIELLGIAGLAWTTWDSLDPDTSAGLKKLQGQGWGHTFGARLGVYWTDVVSKWQFGLESEYTNTQTALETDYATSKLEGDIDNGGMAFRLTLGRRL